MKASWSESNQGGGIKSQSWHGGAWKSQNPRSAVVPEHVPMVSNFPFIKRQNHARFAPKPHKIEVLRCHAACKKAEIRSLPRMAEALQNIM
jgi:hypothetical protein